LMFVGLSPWCFPHGRRFMRGVCPCSARWRESEIAWLTTQEEGRWASRCRKLKVSFRKHKSMGRSPDSADCIWNTTIKEHTLTWDAIICIFMPFSITFQWELKFQVTSPNSRAICESWKHQSLAYSTSWVEFPPRNSNYWWFILQKFPTKTLKP
jgi:hypothetical protein